MSIIKTLFITAILMPLSMGSVYAALINVAPGGTASASGTYLTHTPDNAIDGNTSNMWNSGGFPREWIEIDLGSVFQIVEIKAWVEQLPGGTTNHDVTLDSVLSFSWNGVTDDGDVLGHSFANPVSAQTVRITTTSSPSWVAWNEIEIWAEVSDVPEPSIITLFGLGFLGIGLARRRQIQS